MKYISLNSKSLSIFYSKGRLTEFSGSSKYKVFDKQIVMKQISNKGIYENSSAKEDLLQSLITDDLTDNKNLLLKAELQKEFCLKKTRGGAVTEKYKNNYYKLNKSKVAGKINALFNLTASRKFIAFYSISFPSHITDDAAFECLNLFLTHLRKYFNFSNYLWISERQKCGTLHYHMLTNQFLPITRINQLMSNIIDKKLIQHSLSWGASSREKYNGVDVDSIYNSKRHKKSGKIFDAVEVRNWLSKYLTKYVTKNNEKFSRLAWHCSRSISILFTAELLPFSEGNKFTNYLPSKIDMYIVLESDFAKVFIFLFTPNQKLFERIKLYNNMIFAEFEPTSFICYSNNVTPD